MKKKNTENFQDKQKQTCFIKYTEQKSYQILNICTIQGKKIIKIWVNTLLS